MSAEPKKFESDFHNIGGVQNIKNEKDRRWMRIFKYLVSAGFAVSLAGEVATQMVGN